MKEFKEQLNILLGSVYDIDVNKCIVGVKIKNNRRLCYTVRLTLKSDSDMENKTAIVYVPISGLLDLTKLNRSES